MLLLAYSLGGMSFSKLMAIYRESNEKKGAEIAPYETKERQLFLAEQSFWDYLNGDFFHTQSALYAVWEESGCYLSAMRLEHYEDGLLLEALETVPDHRGRGYAESLIRAVQKKLGGNGNVRIYSHVAKSNKASLRVHRKCGFTVCKDYAVFIDGSIDSRSCTMVYEKENEKF